MAKLMDRINQFFNDWGTFTELRYTENYYIHEVSDDKEVN